MQYTKSNGTKIEPSIMNHKYLESALEKAKRENNKENIIALENEIINRNDL